ncbi:MAG: exosortase/archaeosortase family protein [candidate division Zixibacteria bacterium]
MTGFVRKYYQPLFLIGLSFVFYWPVLVDLVSDWYYDQNYSHGFLIPPVSIFLFYTASIKFEKHSPKPLAGLAIISFAMLLLIFGTAGAEYFTSRFSFVVLLVGIALLYIGWPNFKGAWFSFFFLLFMIPIPNIIYTTLTIPMQLFASKATISLLHAVSVPSDLNGNVIFLPGYPLEVSEACSGLRSLFSLLALSLLVGYLTLREFWPSAILLVLTFPIAVAANIFRIFLTAILAFTVSPDIAEGFLHSLSGLMVFLIALILILASKGVISWAVSRLGS